MTGSSSCGACKFLRRKCASNCVFAPHFSYEDGASHFAAVHRVFGASNVSKLLSHVPTDSRGEAAATVAYEALARMRDPVYGCVGHVYALQHQVASLQEEIEVIGNQMALTSNNYPTDGLQLWDSREQNHARPFTLGAANVHNNNNNVALNSQTNLQIPLVEGRMNPTHAWDSDLAMIPLLGIHDETTEFPMHYSCLNNSSSNRSSI